MIETLKDKMKNDTYIDKEIFKKDFNKKIVETNQNTNIIQYKDNYLKKLINKIKDFFIKLK